MPIQAKRRYFEQLARDWDCLPKPDDQPRKVREFLQRARAAQARRILDAGCGTGILLEGLLELAAPEAMIVELDFALGMLAENAAKFKDSRVVRVCADAAALPFASGAFELVLCFNVAPHLGAPRHALAPLLQTMVPGGRLVIGHLMSSDELNALHAQLDGAVSEDRLMPAADMAEVLAGLGARVDCAEEAPGWYLVCASKTR